MEARPGTTAAVFCQMPRIGGHVRWFLVRDAAGALAWDQAAEQAVQLPVLQAEALVGPERETLPELPGGGLPLFPFVFYGRPSLGEVVESTVPALEPFRQVRRVIGPTVDEVEIYRETARRLGEREEAGLE